MRVYRRIVDRLRWELKEWRQPSRPSFVQEELDQALLDEIDWDVNERVLDVGCAHGDYMRAICDRGARPVGLDLNLSSLLRAKSTGRPVVGASGLQLPFAAGSFDTVLCHKTLHLFPRPLDAVLEFDRVLRPGGRVVFSGSNTQSPYSRVAAAIQARRFENWGFSNRWPPTQWCRAFAKRGFKTRAIYSCNLAWPLVYRVCDRWLIPNEWMRRYVKWIRRVTHTPLRTGHPLGAAMDYVVEIVKPGVACPESKARTQRPSRNRENAYTMGSIGLLNLKTF